MEGAKAISISRPSPRVLGRMKKGLKVRIMKGEGAELFIHPEKFNSITRSFIKGKGVHIELSPHEVSHNMGRGSIFKKAGKALSKVGKEVGKAAEVVKPYATATGKVLLPVAKQIGHEIVKEGVKYAPQLGEYAGRSLFEAAAMASGNPELAKPAGDFGAKLGKAGGKAGGKALGKYADKQIEDYDPYKGKNAPPSRTPDISMLNAYTGQTMGSIGAANMGTAASNQLALANAQVSTPNTPYFAAPSSQVLAPYTDPVPYFNGRGLYAGSGRGLYGGKIREQRLRREMSSVGIHGNLLGGALPPALKSQPYSANFQFGSRLPPAYQQFAKSGSGY